MSGKDEAPTKKNDAPVGESEEKVEGEREDEQDATYQVVDSVGDEAVPDNITSAEETATEQRPRRGTRTSKKDDAKTTKKDDIPSKMKGDAPVREPEGRGEKEEEEQEDTYHVVDSVEDEVLDDVLTATERRPRRGRMVGSSQKDDKMTEKNEAPTKTNGAPVGDSEEKLEGEREREEEQNATYQVVDSVGDEAVPDNITSTEETATEQRPRRGTRTSKKDDAKTSKKDDMPSKMESDAPVGDSEEKLEGEREREDEQDATYQVVDSVGDEAVPDEVTAAEETATEQRPRRGRRSRQKYVKITEKDEAPTKKNDVPLGESEEKLEGEREREEEQDATYQVVDSVGDEAVPDNITAAVERATEQRPRRGARNGKKDDANTTKKDEMPSKMESDAPVGESVEKVEGEREREDEQDATYQVVDSVGDEAVPDNITSAEETATEQRPRRGARTSQKDDKMSEKDEAPTNDAPVGESEDKLEGEGEEEQEATYEVVDSVEDETLPDDTITTEETAAEQRTRRGTRTSKKDAKMSQKDSEENVGRESEREEEQEATYQVVDSVEDETPPEESVTPRPRRGARTRTDKRDHAKTTERNATPPKKSDSGELEEKEGGDEREKEANEDATVSTGADTGSSKKQMKERKTTEEEEEEEELEGIEVRAGDLDSLDEVSDEEENYPDDTAYEEELSRQQAATMWKQLERSEREKDRERWKQLERSESERERRRSKDREERERGSSRSSTRSRGAGGGDGERKRGREREEEEGERKRAREQEEEEEMGLVTLDEVGADEPGEGDEEEERQGDSGNEEGMTEGDLQALVTLDEIVDEEEEEQKCTEVEPRPLEPCPSDHKDETEDAFNPEVPVALGGDEEDRGEDQTQIPSNAAAEPKNDDDDTDEQMNFVTLDEVRDEEEEEEEEVMTTTRRGVRTKRRSRQSVVKGRRTRSSAKQEEESTAAELAPPIAPPTSTETSSSSSVKVQEPQPRRGARTRTSKKDETAKTADKVDAPPEKSDFRELEEKDGGEERGKEAEDGSCAKEGDTPTVFTDADRESSKKVTKERKTTEKEEVEQCQARARVSLDEVSDEEEDYQDEKNDESRVEKHRSQSPAVAADFKLPPFTPNNPIGLEFVVPKTGFFCNLCCVFHENETTAKELHCSTHEHYKNMEKHYQKLQERSGNSAPGPASH